MRRVGVCVLALVALLLAVPAAAQGLGVKAGVTFSTVAVDPPDALGLDVRGRSGLLAGVYVTFREDAKLSLQVDALASLRRISFGDDIDDRLTYLEFPVVARYTVLRRDSLVVRAVGGPAFSYLIEAKETVLGEAPDDIKDAIKSLDTALVIGAQAEWNGRWTFEGRYYFGLSDVYTEPVEGITARQRGFQITAGYRFR